MRTSRYKPYLSSLFRYFLFEQTENSSSQYCQLSPHALTLLYKHYQILVEEFIKGREFSRGIARLKGKITVLPATEIISSKDFFDYEAKYSPGVSKEITPADLPAEQNEKIAEILTEIYLRLNCKGMVRIDFILIEGSNDFYFIEVNTTPGQSVASLVPQQVRAAGLNLAAFYGDLIEGAF